MFEMLRLLRRVGHKVEQALRAIHDEVPVPALYAAAARIERQRKLAELNKGVDHASHYSR